MELTTGLRIAASALAFGLYAWQFAVPVKPGAGASQELSPEKLAETARHTRALLDAGKFAPAVARAKVLAAAMPGNHIYIGYLAEGYHGLGRFREEAAEWERFLTVAPIPVEGCAELDHAYMALRDRARQADAADRCLAFEPENPDLIFTRGHVYEMNGDQAHALEYYQRGLHLAPTHGDLLIGAARVALRSGKTAEALAEAERLAAAQPRNADALLLLGMALIRSGQPDRARQALERGLEVAPNYGDIRELLEGLPPATPHSGPYRPAEAVEGVHP